MSPQEKQLRELVADEVQRLLTHTPTETMSADQVAVLLGVDRKTVYDYSNRGLIPCRKLGKRLLFSRPAVVAWLRCESALPEQG